MYLMLPIPAGRSLLESSLTSTVLAWSLRDDANDMLCVLQELVLDSLFTDDFEGDACGSGRVMHAASISSSAESEDGTQEGSQGA